MQLEARMTVVTVEMTDAVQVSLYWELMREWALGFMASQQSGLGKLSCGEDEMIAGVSKNG